jgi:hypothetical protein
VVANSRPMPTLSPAVQFDLRMVPPRSDSI